MIENFEPDGYHLKFPYWRQLNLKTFYILGYVYSFYAYDKLEMNVICWPPHQIYWIPDPSSIILNWNPKIVWYALYSCSDSFNSSMQTTQT